MNIHKYINVNKLIIIWYSILYTYIKDKVLFFSVFKYISYISDYEKLKEIECSKVLRLHCGISNCLRIFFAAEWFLRMFRQAGNVTLNRHSIKSSFTAKQLKWQSCVLRDTVIHLPKYVTICTSTNMMKLELTVLLSFHVFIRVYIYSHMSKPQHFYYEEWKDHWLRHN